MSIEVMNRVLPTIEAAHFLGVSPSTLITWRCRGGGPKSVKVGRRKIGYRLVDLLNYVEERSRRIEAGTAV